MSEKYVFELGAEAEEYAKENLNETEETREKALNEIHAWLTEEKTNLNARLEPRYILPFLRQSKFNIEEAKTKIINYYNLRRDNAKWFTDRDPTNPELAEIIKVGVFIPLRKLYKNQVVFLIRTAAHDPKKHSQENVFKVDHMILDIAALFEFEMAHIYGAISIFDMNGVTAYHAKQLTPGIVKRSVTAWGNYHTTSKNYDFINSPTYLNVILNIFKSFMSEKMKRCTRVHTKGIESLHQIVDKEILPEEYGGNDGKLEDLINYWYEKLVNKRDWLLEDEKYRAD
ncbi:retinol-binding protein pinta [Diabrotica virgifera virgifera]|uniref:CRAL-TRIO domain-containing protein n=1 Tax=Diabrotica virgifera virgifera TaxID=50390 RepID=A0ABM5JV57_DIAVI|nr:retinol-binding protein pinta [Diabrotica virgifera virgifera]XP_050501821.1 retinol-binding protein pinta [Diabrotica virgifera virgifera]